MKTVHQALPTYGRGLFSTLDESLFGRCVVYTAPEPWAEIESSFPAEPLAVTVPATMERKDIERLIDGQPQANAVFGVGGGTACDAAKLHAFRRGARLVLVPTILSVDAPYTKAVGIRVGGRVRYVGEVYPDYLLVDFDLLERSPKRLNRAGVGDVLSIFTALFDWNLARDVRGESYDHGIATDSQALLNRLLASAEAVRACGEEGLRLISELYVAEVALCERFGNSRPEEGSEHYFAYAVESDTRRHFIHGELIACAVLLTGLRQGQDVTAVKAFLDECGVAYRPKEIGLSYREMEKTLCALPSFLAAETQLPYGIYHHRDIDKSAARALVASFRELFE
ncbi:MAG: iron-containing alcohol dehydrogenase [Deltaproteobacteria bacterium]|nr:iron-containing alcohol dehydrogenase [Deltaproteobacteria bacterium]